MKTETHLDLAIYLRNKHLYNRSTLDKAAFVVGCVEPDVNLCSYLKGFNLRPFFGHNWENAEKYILNCAEKTDRGHMGYLGMGRFVHYICDAFTFPHNKAYRDGLSKHTLYEKRLHTRVLEYCSRDESMDFQKPSTHLGDWVESLHKRYCRIAPSEETDAKFIFFAADCVVSRWVEQTAKLPETAIGRL